MASTMTADPPQGATITVPQVIDQVWQYVSSQVSSGAVNDVLLPMAFKTIIGQQGLDIIATRFRYLIQSPVTVVEDASLDAIHIIAVRSAVGNPVLYGPQVPKAAAPKKTKVPRPPNAFILYRQHHHPLIAAENPGMLNTQISIILGNQWRNEDQATKLHWKEMAEEIKQKHFVDHPEYSYQPRKPTDRKRRMTRKKAAVLSSMSTTLFTPTSVTPVSDPPTTATTSSIDSALSQASTFASELITPYTYENYIGELPELEKTDAGNPVVYLGDENLPDEKLLFMLEDYNNTSLPSPPTQAMVQASQYSPVLFTGRSEEAANDAAFYESMIDFDELAQTTSNLESQFEAEFAAGWNGTLDGPDDFGFSNLTSQFDEQFAYVDTAELIRNNGAWP
ncbi:MAG: hypothetical protein Q9187_006793 [Circinaria calcarea]